MSGRECDRRTHVLYRACLGERTRHPSGSARWRVGGPPDSAGFGDRIQHEPFFKSNNNSRTENVVVSSARRNARRTLRFSVVLSGASRAPGHPIYTAPTQASRTRMLQMHGMDV